MLKFHLTDEFSIALFLLGRYHEALFSISLATKYIDKSNQRKTAVVDVWTRKIEAKLENSKSRNIKVPMGTNIDLGVYDENYITINEIPSIDQSKDILDLQSSPSTGSIKALEPAATPNITANATSEAKLNANTETVAPTAPPAPQEVSVDKIKFDWYQNATSVNISLFIKNAPKDDVKVQFEPTLASVTFPLPTGSDFVYGFDPLADCINPEASSFKVFGTKIELTLKKATETKWPTLLGSDAEHASDDKATTAPTAEAAQKGLGLETPSYPTSSKHGPKNWDSILKDEIDEMEKKENEDDPNAFFKSIFSQADPDTQRAMMKSYTESNGTALSTNWEETSKKKYDTNPPDGMEAKLWNR